MYHIKPDKRSQASAALIADGLYKCLEVKNFSNITISDIQRASTVGRATFYRLFDNLSDVLEYECDNAFRQMLLQYDANATVQKDASPFENLFIYFMEYFLEHTLLLDALADGKRIDIMSRVFAAHTDEIKKILVPDSELTQTELEYFVSVATGALLGAFFTWTKRSKKESGSELLSLLKCSVNIVEKSL